ncbi:2-hydroxyacid dehydrogenase [Bordetella sp. H567]|uniref:NAD(P)-dependent oxidoreductase n=1 Tax=Bordetella sp. H567 TaxID=1697043 RepID=UPI00081CA09D|nr:NAD(P)-dependent oxidoreductase [Bordetella sp. H567]AOB29983.1 2-hydroxyacid dehydrogenase [Bordetella sp. H567]
MTTILLTHSPQALANYYGERALHALRELGEVRLNPGADPTTPQDVIRLAQGCQIVISSRLAAAPAAVFEALPDLVAYCRVAVDIRNIDVDAASRHGVLVTQATPGFDASVSEWVLGVMIDASRNISRAAAAYWGGQAAPVVMGRELRGATVGIIGHGHIGRYLARACQALGMRVLVQDPQPQTLPDGMRQVERDALLADSDYVVCLAPALPETANLMGRDAYARMKREAVFINASRGELVDEEALRDALDSGTIAGCALDVGRAQDQMPSLGLAAHPRVIATPHIGGLTPQAAEHQAMDTVAQVRAILRGETPPHAVNLPHATRLARLRR